MAAIVVFILVYLAAFVVPRPVRAWPAWANAVLTWLVLAGCLAVLTRILGVHALLYSPSSWPRGSSPTGYAWA